MNGLTMDYQLTIPAILRRAEQLHGRKGIATRRPDKSMRRYTYAEMVERAKRLAVALAALGVADGDRVATLCWNHHEHLEAYFGIPSAGAVLHTLNLRLHPDDQTYIVGNAGDKALLVDDVLLPVFEKFRDRVDIGHVIVIPTSGAPVPDSMLDYEKLLAAADPAAFVYRAIDERQAAAMCYTSGTTGKPKGVLYSHRCIALHSMGSAQRDVLDVGESDVVLPVVPMFHANAWGLPFTATLTGATQVFPGQHLDATSLLELFQDERVTMTAGVPTIWFGILQTLDKNPGAYDLSALRSLVVGGSAAPPSMIEGFQERHGLRVIHAWGMTEMTPLGTVARVTSDLRDAPPEEQYAYRATQGRPAPFIEIRARSEDGLVPWDGEAMGELEVRGPWVVSAYYNNPGPDDRFTDDGWFRTGDIVTIDARGYVTITDRAKDVVKSGGEWISTVALENALMAHPAVLEAAVIAVPHPKWDERPLACVVLKEGEQATAEDLLALLQADFAKFWIPDGVEFIDEIPHTATGKFLKTALRERYRDYAMRGSQ
ncbi:MAG: long-chain fatty acid--CoA ligase [Chloroflexota bacterium]|nr:long-chain fatty acid--CoA ligase [Chloroflexota bacterium]